MVSVVVFIIILFNIFDVNDIDWLVEVNVCWFIGGEWLDIVFMLISV